VPFSCSQSSTCCAAALTVFPDDAKIRTSHGGGQLHAAWRRRRMSAGAQRFGAKSCKDEAGHSRPVLPFSEACGPPWQSSQRAWTTLGGAKGDGASGRGSLAIVYELETLPHRSEWTI
jgi:hypothetical protein